jgi:hypothetical protein
MSKHNYKIAAIFFVFMVLSRAADNPFTGKWKIDASKSSFSDGTFPKNMSIVIDLNFSTDELNYHSVNDTNKTKPTGTDYTAKLDWKPYPLANNARYNQVAVRRLNEREFEVLELKDGDVIVGAIYELLPGGRRFVRRGIAKTPDGRSREYEEFFDKQ